MTTNTLRSRVIKYSYTIGRTEDFGPGFAHPVYLARAKGDLLYVLSRAREIAPQGKRVTICTVGEDYVSEFGTGGSDDGQFMWPVSLALDRDENVYVSDEHLQRISIFTKDGEWLGKWGVEGDGDGQFNRPSGLAFDKEDNLLLADALNNRIQKFTKDGQFLDKWGAAGTGDGEFNMPWGITVDQEGYIYVADWRNDRIQKFTPNGQFLMKFGTSGKGDGKLHRPTGIAVDSDGDIYVTDWGNELMQVFAPDGTFITQFAGDATLSKWGKEKLDANPEMYHEREISYRLDREKLFWAPMAVDVDKENRIFVADTCRNRIQIYKKGD